jgi:hAT family dimerisation domain.
MTWRYIRVNLPIRQSARKYKLVNTISTIPATTASGEQRFSAVMRIKIYLRSTKSQYRSTGQLMQAQKALVAALKKPPSFYDVIIKKFLVETQRNFIPNDQNVSGKNLDLMFSLCR